jgi:hypothetical protein
MTVSLTLGHFKSYGKLSGYIENMKHAFMDELDEKNRFNKKFRNDALLSFFVVGPFIIFFCVILSIFANCQVLIISKMFNSILLLW